MGMEEIVVVLAVVSGWWENEMEHEVKGWSGLVVTDRRLAVEVAQHVNPALLCHGDKILG